MDKKILFGWVMAFLFFGAIMSAIGYLAVEVCVSQDDQDWCLKTRVYLDEKCTNNNYTIECWDMKERFDRIYSKPICDQDIEECDKIHNIWKILFFSFSFTFFAAYIVFMVYNDLNE